MTKNTPKVRGGSASSRAAAAAAVRREQERRERRRQFLVVGASVVALLVVVGIGVFIQSTRDTSGDTAGQASFPTSDVPLGDTSVAAADTYGIGIGNPDAAVKVEVFEDFLCPFCGEYEAAGRTSLRQAAVDGDAYIVYRPIAFLGDYSTRALNAFYVVLDTAGAATALKFHDLLYENQPSESEKAPDDTWLIDRAVEAGAERSAVTQGIEDREFEQNVTNATDDASKRGVNATPTVYADGEALSGTTIDDLVTQTLDAIEEGQ